MRALWTPGAYTGAAWQHVRAIATRKPVCVFYISKSQVLSTAAAVSSFESPMMTCLGHQLHVNPAQQSRRPEEGHSCCDSRLAACEALLPRVQIFVLRCTQKQLKSVLTCVPVQPTLESRSTLFPEGFTDANSPVLRQGDQLSVPQGLNHPRANRFDPDVIQQLPSGRD